MDRKTALIGELEKFKKNVSRELPIKKIIFFGSRVTGKFREYSDVDLVIISSKFKKQKHRRRPLILYNYWDLDYPVDFLCYTPEEFEKKRKQITIVREAVKEGIVI